MVIFQTNSNIELTHLWVFRTETLNKRLRLTRTLNWITLAKYRCCLSANIQTHVPQKFATSSHCLGRITLKMILMKTTMTVMITMKMTPTTMMMTRSKALLPIMRGDSRRHCEGGGEGATQPVSGIRPVRHSQLAPGGSSPPTHPLGHLATRELSHTCTSRKQLQTRETQAQKDKHRDSCKHKHKHNHPFCHQDTLALWLHKELLQFLQEKMFLFILQQVHIKVHIQVHIHFQNFHFESPRMIVKFLLLISLSAGRFLTQKILELYLSAEVSNSNGTNIHNSARMMAGIIRFTFLQRARSQLASS